MTMATILEVFERYLGEYLKANKIRKTEILDSVCELTGFHRKAAVRKFSALQFRSVYDSDHRGRPVIYGPDVTAALKDVWQASSEICGELIYPVISEYVAVMKRDGQWHHRPDTTAKLLAMSEGTVKARVSKFMKARHFRHGLSSTSPSLLKNIIPIVVGEWADKPPGYGQVDTVVHCGSSLLGDLVFTFNYTDIATLWHGLASQWNKGQIATSDSLERIKSRLPFPLKGIHPDTGSEFINWYLKGLCDQNKIELTRSRPNHKNDNAYVEQKNGHVVRRFMGYTRLDTPEVVPLINEMYVILETYLNHFVPSRKCLNKVRIGARYKRVYDQAQTPYQRVLVHPVVTDEIKAKLKLQHEELNPLLLKQQIDKLIMQIFKIQRENGNPTQSEKSQLR